MNKVYRLLLTAMTLLSLCFLFSNCSNDSDDDNDKDYDIASPIIQPTLTCPDSKHPHMIDLGLPSNTLWACCNVGAESPEQYGDYFSWGETSRKSAYNWKTYKYASTLDDEGRVFVHPDDIGSDIAGTKYDVAMSIWGNPWCVPTEGQCKELIDNCSKKNTTIDGVQGLKLTGTNGGSIFLPAAGKRTLSWTKGSVGGAYGDYWSSSLYAYGLPLFEAVSMNFYTSNKFMHAGHLDRYIGLPVRPVIKP